MARVAASADVPDTILPAQFFAGSTWSETPEKKLMFAVLMDAIVQLQRGDPDGMLDAERWIRGELPDAPILFPDVCDALGLESQNLADGLMTWRRQSQRVPRVQHRVSPVGRLRSRDKTAAKTVSLGSG